MFSCCGPPRISNPATITSDDSPSSNQQPIMSQPTATSPNQTLPPGLTPSNTTNITTTTQQPPSATHNQVTNPFTITSCDDNMEVEETTPTNASILDKNIATGGSNDITGDTNSDAAHCPDPGFSDEEKSPDTDCKSNDPLPGGGPKAKIDPSTDTPMEMDASITHIEEHPHSSLPSVPTDPSVTTNPITHPTCISDVDNPMPVFDDKYDETSKETISNPTTTPNMDLPLEKEVLKKEVSDKDEQFKSELSKVRSSPIPKRRSISSGYSFTNLRYSIDHLPTPDHANDDRRFVFEIERGYKVFGVFDGHDGSNASEFAVMAMEAYLRAHLTGSDGKNIENILVNMFQKIDKAFFKRINGVLERRQEIRQILQGLNSYEAYMQYPYLVSEMQDIDPVISGGTTAVVAILVNGVHLYVANVGDSWAMLVEQVDDGKGTLNCTKLSVDHTTDNEYELNRLQTLGLDREELKRTGRLGSQENTRCIGDYMIKKGYKEVDSIRKAVEPPGIATPDINDIEVPQNAQYLLLMTDGVYKSIESMHETPPTHEQLMNEIAERVIQAHEDDTRKSNQISERFLERLATEHKNTYTEHAKQDVRSLLAVQCRKRDDMTLVVHKLK